MKLPILTLLSGLVITIMLPLIGCQDDPLSASNCRQTTIIAGVEDDFQSGDQEDSSPSPGMLKFMDYAYRIAPNNPLNQLTTRFDETMSNRAFGHTLTLKDIPEGMVIKNVKSATLTIRLKALSGDVANDALFILDPNENGEVVGVGGAEMSKIVDKGVVWMDGVETTVVLDLAKLPTEEGTINMLDYLRDGEISVYVQDDTSVDYIKLDVTYCVQQK